MSDLQPVEIEILRVCAFKKKPPEDRKGRKVQPQGCARCGEAKRWPGHLGAPPSLNVLGSGNPMVFQDLKERWSAMLAERLEQAELPRGLSRVQVEGEATFPDRTRRDQGNFRVLLEKALGDTLTAGGWLADDDWESYSFGDLAYRYERGVSRTRLMLFPTARPTV